MTFGEKLRAYRDAHALTQEQLAEKLGTSKQVISRYEKNQRSPKLSVAIKYAEALLLPAKYFVDDETPVIPEGFIPVPRMQRVPIVGAIACGEPITAEENVEGYAEAPSDRHVDFALVCKGESMVDAGIRDGDIVYIKKQPEVENGQIAAVRIDGEATLKRVYKNGDTLILQPANALFPPLSFKGDELENVVIEGLAVGYTHWI